MTLIILLTILIFVYLICFTNRKKPTNKNFESPIATIFHRGGFKNVAVENSKEAIMHAISKKCDFIELDVQWTKDQELIIFHDDCLKRLAQNEKKLTELTYEEIKKTTLTQNGFTAKISSLDDLLTLQKKHKFCIFLDVKPAAANNKKFVSQIYNTIRSHNLVDRICITSFSPLVLYYFRSLDKNMTLSLSVERTSDSQCAILYYKFLTGILPNLLGLNFLLIQFDLFSINFVKRQAKNNVQVLAWTINGETDQLYLKNQKIGYLTDIT